MRSVGVTSTLLKVISLNQGSTDEILTKNPEELCHYILEISGDKEVIDHYQETSEKLKLTQKEYKRIEEELAKEQQILGLLKSRVDTYQSIKQLQANIAEAEFKLPIVEIRDLRMKTDELSVSINRQEEYVRTSAETVKRNRNELSFCSEEYGKLEKRLKEHVASVDELSRTLNIYNKKMVNLAPELQELEKFIKEYGNQPKVDIEKLRVNLVKLNSEYKSLELEILGLKNESVELSGRINELKERLVYPPHVEKIRSALNQEGIHYLLLAEWIDIPDERWREPIECLLGSERFTIIVDGSEETLIRSKEIAERLHYRSYVQAPSYYTGEIALNSAMAKVAVLDEKVSGCLRWLNNIRLVDSVREGHELAKQGIKSLTDQAYQQDKRGGISYYLTNPRDRRYCGKKAREFQLEQAQEQHDKVQSLLEIKQARDSELYSGIEGLRKDIDVQEKVLEVPARKERLESVRRNYDAIAGEADRLNKKFSEGAKTQLELSDQKEEFAKKINTLEKGIDELEKAIKGTRDAAERDKSTLDSTLKSVEEKAKVLSEEQLVLLDDKQYLDNLPRWDKLDETKRISEDSLKNHNLDDFFGIEERYEDQDRRVSHATLQVGKKSSEVERYISENDNALKAYIDMVENVLENIRSALREQAKLIPNVRIHCNFDRVGGAPKWKIDYKIGFDGKSPVRYNHSNLSGGQGVIVAILLLMAAIKADEKSFSFMILDEPTAHLDADRMQIVGEFLRGTKAQYIITAPYTDNVTHLGWVNMSLITRIKLPEDKTAPPIAYGIVNPDYVQERTGLLF